MTVGRSNRIRAWVVGAVLAAAVGGSFSPAVAQDGGSLWRRFRSRDDTASGFRENPKMRAAFRDVVTRPSRSVVRVQAAGRDVALGTVVDAGGWVLTKNSELPAGAKLSVLVRGVRSVDAKVVGVNTKYDLAMLRVDASDLAPIAWGDSRAATPGDLLASPGTSFEPVAVGVLSVAARPVGRFDLPQSTPRADAGFLGVGPEEDPAGARIATVAANSAAEKAGLKVGDLVLLIADTPIGDPETLFDTIQQHRPGDVIAIKVVRDGKEIEVRATLEKRPPEPAGAAKRDIQNRMGSELSARRGGFPQVLQHDMALKPSDCGGPVVDLDGKAVGINIARAGRVESYAIPAEAVRGLIAELKGGKPTTRPVTMPATAPATTTRPK